MYVELGALDVKSGGVAFDPYFVEFHVDLCVPLQLSLDRARGFNLIFDQLSCYLVASSPGGKYCDLTWLYVDPRNYLSDVSSYRPLVRTVRERSSYHDCCVKQWFGEGYKFFWLGNSALEVGQGDWPGFVR